MRGKRAWRAAMAAVLTVVLAVSPTVFPTPVYAETLSDLESQKEELEQQKQKMTTSWQLWKRILPVRRSILRRSRTSRMSWRNRLTR